MPSADRTPPGPSTEAGTGHELSGGPGRLIVALYAVLALAATGRSILQITQYFDRAEVAYILSAVAALIYIVATYALATGRRTLATSTIAIELAGVLVVGVVSYLATSAFPDKTVWSHFGSGYGYVPLVLPIVGLWWLRRSQAGTAAG